MSLIGLGNDIIEIDRIRSGVEKHGERFLQRLFTSQEIAYCRKYQDPFPSFAGRFAAKEAVVKAIGTGFGETASWHDIEILADAVGKPCVHLSKNLEKKLGQCALFVSISHCKQFATAVALKMGKTVIDR